MSICKIIATGAMIAAGGVALGIAAAPADAGVFPSNPVGVQECSYATSVPSQECLNTPTYRVKTTTGAIAVQFRAAPSHCFKMIAHIIVDGKERGKEVLGAGESDGGYVMRLSPGIHKVGVRATGIPGGCNPGYLETWGGNLTIETDADAADGIG
ncbi:MAG: hypothetical protein WAV90_09400 [Gordonia amarae]